MRSSPRGRRAQTLRRPRFDPGRAAVAALTAMSLAAVAPALAQTEVRIDAAADGGPALPGWWFGAGAGKAARPALVLLHGCGGVHGRSGRLAERYTELAQRLNARGVHALVVDSLGPRGERELCTQPMAARGVSQQERRRDALLALQWLAARGDVDRARIGLLGWSHGGSAVLAATNLRHPAVAAAPVRATLAVAFYPGCSAELARGYQPAAPLLMLLGADDDWTPPAPCQKLAETATGAPDATVPAPRVQTYAGAVHGFDGTAPVRVRHDVPNGVRPGGGVMVGAQPAAREAARDELDAFLAAHWGVQAPAAPASPATAPTSRTTAP